MTEVNREDAIHGAQGLIERLEREGPLPGSPFDWELAIKGLHNLIERLEGKDRSDDT